MLIIEKALELFAKNGIDATSVQDITNACGISKGAFYLSFKSKEDLLVAIIDHFMKLIVAKNAGIVRMNASVKERLHQYYLANFQIFFQFSPFFTIYLREHMRSINRDIVEKVNEFEKINDETVLVLVDELLGEDNHPYRYDLLLMMKGFVYSFAGYILMYPQQYDLEKLAKAFVERTCILAEHPTEALLTGETWKQMMLPNGPTLETVEQLAGELMKRHADDDLVSESVRLLVDELKSPAPRRAIVKGLIANLQTIEDASWFIFCVEYVWRAMHATHRTPVDAAPNL